MGLGQKPIEDLGLENSLNILEFTNRLLILDRTKIMPFMPLNDTIQHTKAYMSSHSI